MKRPIEKKAEVKSSNWLRDLLSKTSEKFTSKLDADEKIGTVVERNKPKDLPPLKTSDISAWAYFKLWFWSWAKNEAKAELEGTHSPLPFTLTGGFPYKTAIIIVGIVVSLIAISC